MNHLIVLKNIFKKNIEILTNLQHKFYEFNPLLSCSNSNWLIAHSQLFLTSL